METEVGITIQVNSRLATRWCYILFEILDATPKDHPNYLPLLKLFDELAPFANTSFEKITDEYARFALKVRSKK